ncbi:MAG: OmpA family protein [Myxococcales bacterium]|nr:OmpA family protein [Myxococcales bacterium]
MPHHIDGRAAQDDGARGHCDPRGELTYNFALGQLRAGTVENHILARGVERSRVESSSRGELDAVGIDETSWALDRSVAISMTDEETN